MKPQNPRIQCQDGTSLSVQANRFAYCRPRDDNGPYTAMEVGFIQDKNGQPVIPPQEWEEYAEDGSFPSDVYGYVPIELVESFIDSHGGRIATHSS